MKLSTFFAPTWLVAILVTIIGCGGSESRTESDNAESVLTNGTNAGSRNSSGDSDASGQDSKPKTSSDDEQASRQLDREIPKFEFKYEPPKSPETAMEADELLAQLKKKYDSTNIPRNLNPPFTREAAMEFVKAIVVLKESAKRDADAIEAIKYDTLTGSDAGSTRYFERQQESAVDRIRNYATKEIDQSIALSRESLKLNSKSQLTFLERGATVDLEDRSAVATHLSDDLVKQRNQEFLRTLDTIDVAMFFDTQFGQGDEDYDRLRKQVMSWQSQHNENLAKAADSVMPPKDIGDAELMEVAKQVLTDSKYELPKAERIIPTTRKRRENRVEYTVDDGTIYRVERAWEEFQVATIEKHGERYFIYFNTLKYFTKGASTTPLEKWVLGERFRSAPIAEKNISP